MMKFDWSQGVAEHKKMILKTKTYKWSANIQKRLVKPSYRKIGFSHVFSLMESIKEQKTFHLLHDLA